MCAIAGVIGCGDADILKRMNKVMAHRGPDASGTVWFDEHHAGFGHNRLAIIDLTPGGAQPMSSRDGRHWIVFNGEIYNFAALREVLEALGHVFRSLSDTEVLLAGLIEWGEGCLNKLNGMFAFAWLDRLTGRVLLARDHLGIKPLYYTEADGGLVFASEIKALLRHPGVRAVRDDLALRNPSRFLLSPRTGFEGIHKLPPAHCMVWENAKLTVRAYWEITPTESLKDENEALEHLGPLIESVVKKQMIADVPVGAFLSGGLDSSLVCALMRKQTSGDIKAFTIKFSSADQRFEQAGNDSYYAKRVAERFEFDFHEFEIAPNIVELLPLMVWHMDEPLSDPAAINTYLMSKAAHELDIIVLLNGVGADEVFGGYRKHLACLRAEDYQRWCPAPVRRMVQRFVDRLPVATETRGLLMARWLKRFVGYASLPEAERYLASDLSLSPQAFTELYLGADYYETPFWKQQRGTMQDGTLSYLTRMCLNDTRVFLPEHNLTYTDKATMAASIEARPPLVDKDVVAAMFTTAPELRIKGNLQKSLLRGLAEKLLPREVVQRPKASFNSPLRSWIRGPLRGLVDELLSTKGVKERGLHDPATVRRIVEEDRAGKADHSMWIWTLLTVELWHRTFLDNGAKGPVGV